MDDEINLDFSPKSPTVMFPSDGDPFPVCYKSFEIIP